MRPSTIILALGLGAASTLALWIPNRHENAVLVPRGLCCSKPTYKPPELPPSASHTSSHAGTYFAPPSSPVSSITGSEVISLNGLDMSALTASDTSSVSSGSQSPANSPNPPHPKPPYVVSKRLSRRSTEGCGGTAPGGTTPCIRNSGTDRRTRSVLDSLS